LKPKQLYGLFSVGEAITWGLLITALVLRAVGNPVPEAIVIAGSSHGAMFLAYCTTAVLVGVNQRWKFGKIAISVFLAIIPFATIPWDRRLVKTESLSGAWRTGASADPRDSHWFDQLFRWFIARPMLLIVVLITFVALLFVVLLSRGSPTTWGR